MHSVTRRYIRTEDGRIFDITNIKGAPTCPIPGIFKEACCINPSCDGFILVTCGISFKFFDWLSLNTDNNVVLYDKNEFRKVCLNLKQLNDKSFAIYGYIVREDNEITLVAKLTKTGEFELL